MIRGRHTGRLAKFKVKMREFIVANYENEIEEVQNEMIKGLEMKTLNDKPYCFISTRNSCKYW